MCQARRLAPALGIGIQARPAVAGNPAVSGWRPCSQGRQPHSQGRRTRRGRQLRSGRQPCSGRRASRLLLIYPALLFSQQKLFIPDTVFLT